MTSLSGPRVLQATLLSLLYHESQRVEQPFCAQHYVLQTVRNPAAWPSATPAYAGPVAGLHFPLGQRLFTERDNDRAFVTIA